MSRYVNTETKARLNAETHCCICSEKFTTENPREAGHNQPFSRGGSSSGPNMRAECMKCNRKKGSKTTFQHEMDTYGTAFCQGYKKDGKQCDYRVADGSKRYCKVHGTQG